MEVAMGAMGALLPKLGELLSEEYNLQKSANKDLRFLQRELQSMNAALSSVAEVPRDELTVQDRLWAGDVRELSQDIEDILESFLVSVECSVPPSNADGFKVLKLKMASLFKMAKARRDVATAVKNIKGQVTEVANRDERYRGRGGVIRVPSAAAGSKITIDPLLSVLYANQKTVGMDAVRDEIVEKLLGVDDMSKKQPKVVSIVGSGGLGKTTLAKSVYDCLAKGFDCKAFVSVSRNPDVKKVLKDLLFELDEAKYRSSNLLAELDERQLIHKLREALQARRYFIVIDDIWNTEAWEIIKLAFTGSSCKSRIITTTRNADVAKACCSPHDNLIHNMKPLSEVDSRKLFYTRIFATETGCPPQLEQLSRDILKKCGGMPLAIITLASHLASNQQKNPKDRWIYLLKSIGTGLIDGGGVEQMKKILSYSYYDLPRRLRSCFLYLSVFPEDFRIDRVRLIRRWIAEGFLDGENHESGIFELGESYFNELINRSMIIPISIDAEGRASACYVHDIMLDLICELSNEENFVTILDIIKGETPFTRKVRRLSLQKNMPDLTNTRLATRSMSHVRSFTVFSPAINQMLPLSRFEILRVLDLEGCYLGGSCHVNLRCVGKLVHLRYLGLRKTQLVEIPMEIGKLVLLQILDLYGVGTKELPASVCRLRNLICMNLTVRMHLPVGFRDLTSIEELTGVWFREFGDSLEALCYLTKLRVLSLTWPGIVYRPEQGELVGPGQDDFIILVESLSKLLKLQSLNIFVSDDDIIDVMQSWVPPPDLSRLELRGWFETFPAWISSSSLPLLTYLRIKVYEMRLEDIETLGTLPVLRHVYVESTRQTAVPEERFVLRADAFPCAQECILSLVRVVPWMFTPGAMPMVRRLEFALRISDIVSAAEFDLNIRNLPSLEDVVISICEESMASQGPKAESMVRRAVENYPNRRLGRIRIQYRY